MSQREPVFNELEAAITRFRVGVTRQSTPHCEWYEGIGQDALDELEAVLDASEAQCIGPSPDDSNQVLYRLPDGRIQIAGHASS